MKNKQQSPDKPDRVMNRAILEATETDYVSEMVKPFVINGQTAFTHVSGIAPYEKVEHAYYQVTYILKDDYVPLFFDCTQGKTGDAHYFKETYRVMCIATPNRSFKIDGAIPVPIPTFFGCYSAGTYMIGVCLNKNRSINAPAVTPWVSMDSATLYTTA